jgi:hypothetical protein
LAPDALHVYPNNSRSALFGSGYAGLGGPCQTDQNTAQFCPRFGEALGPKQKLCALAVKKR